MGENPQIRMHILYVKFNNMPAFIDYIQNKSDAQLIQIRSDLKEYIGRYHVFSNIFSILSMLVAIGIVAFPRIFGSVSGEIDRLSLVAIVVELGIEGLNFLLLISHNIGKYHKVLSLLEDCCKIPVSYLMAT